jgi:hypothetical protein
MIASLSLNLLQGAIVAAPSLAGQAAHVPDGA